MVKIHSVFTELDDLNKFLWRHLGEGIFWAYSLPETRYPNRSKEEHADNRLKQYSACFKKKIENKGKLALLPEAGAV